MDINQQSCPGMWQYPRNDDLCCIYRVPNGIRDVNPEAYTPQLVLIGPLHHSLKSQALKSLDRGDDITFTKSMGYLNTEKHKKIYLEKFAQRVEGEKTINEFRRTIEEDEEFIRASYSDSTAWIQSQEFVEMVLHDSVFIVELILRVTEIQDNDSEKRGDHIMDNLSHAVTVRHDLMLLENQLPYFILEKLFDPILPRIRQYQTFRELIIFYFGFQDQIGNNSKFRHFIDLFRCVRVETLPMRERNERVFKPKLPIHSADKLVSGGVKLKAGGEELSLNVTFDNGCLKIPSLMVYDGSEVVLRNIMALEQCHYPFNPHVCDYITFLDFLIDTEKDVDLLIEKGIIINFLGQPALVARMVNKLGLGICVVDSYYYDVTIEAITYYRNPVKGSQAILKRVYFSNLWTGTATMAATFLLVMTLIQTWASVIQVRQNASE